ncbi:hypothetical protein VNO80_18538 [Phaseolus coccineus]|uniref:Uncharacterized protein n=1 Tax=Phaseolus coccineus TaxID=3886 RepID=A0AAN9QZ08_PHACN
MRVSTEQIGVEDFNKRGGVSVLALSVMACDHKQEFNRKSEGGDEESLKVGFDEENLKLAFGARFVVAVVNNGGK